MAKLEITKQKIENHIEKVGIDLRPIVEPKMEEIHFRNFYNSLRDKYPNLFESLVQSPNDFQIRKKFIFPGKGEMDHMSAAFSHKGMTLVFPRIIAALNEEITVGNTEDIIMDCIRLLRDNFAAKTIRRVGHINEYIYTLGSHNSIKFITEKFTKVKASTVGEVRLSVNIPTDDYNRIVELRPVEKLEMAPEMPGNQSVVAYGVHVKVDFNNRETSSDLDFDRIRSIIQGSFEFNDKHLYQFLNASNIEGESQ